MRPRKLGRQGPNVSAMGLGCMSLGIADTYTSSVRNDDGAIALIQHALELGITLLDTADIFGESETSPLSTSSSATRTSRGSRKSPRAASRPAGATIRRAWT